MNICKKIQSTLAGEGARAVRGDAEAEAHIAECEECYNFLLAFNQIDTELSNSAAFNPPDELVQRTLARIEDVSLKELGEKRKRKVLVRTRPIGKYTIGALIGLPVLGLILTRDGALAYLEGSFGALVMLSAGIGAIMSIAFRNLKMAGSLATICLGAFMVRSVTSTFFNTTSLEDGELQGAIAVYNDERIYGEIYRSSPSSRDRVDSKGKVELEKSRALADKEAYKDIVGAISSKMESPEQKYDQQAKKSAELDNKIEEYDERTAELFKRILNNMADMHAGQGSIAGADESYPVDMAEADLLNTNMARKLTSRIDDTAAIGMLNSQTDSLETLRDLTPKELLPPQPSQSGFIGAGDSVKVKLLAGVKAPTDGTPYPVLFKLEGDVFGPDGSVLPLDNARLIASAQGSLTDSRVLYRLQQLSIRLPDGKRSVYPIDGWVVGEDGLRGMQGIAIDPIEKGVAAGGMAGGLAKNNQGADSTGGSFAAGRAAADSSEEWGGIVADRVKQLVPHVEVYAGREGTAVFAQPLKLSFNEVLPKGLNTLEQILAERKLVENLPFKTPRGYWSNTYIPGDPLYRLLAARLDGEKSSELNGLNLSELKLSLPKGGITQPLDAPASSALALYVSSDKRSVNGSTRMLMQVGIKGSVRPATNRPALSVAIVLDESEFSAGALKKVKELLLSFERARLAGDNFSLFISSENGSQLLNPERFKFGELNVALDNLITKKGDKAAPSSPAPAFSKALAALKSGSSENTPLGNSAIFLITNKKLDSSLSELKRFAEQGVLSGIETSVIGLEGSDLSALSDIALSGHGHRYMLDNGGDVEPLVSRALNASSQVVARALRLNMKLAKGVKLVDVIGSKKLETSAIRIVKAAEKQIDKRLEQTVGIQADRGEDDDGMQIIIPAFYSGDTHVLLLDLVVPGPGAVADVSVRYKDLITMKNGANQTSFAVEHGEGKAGPLENNVTRNFIVNEVAKRLTQAGEAVSKNQDAKAKELITEALHILDELKKKLPEVSDQELMEKQQKLSYYIKPLEGGALHSPAARTYLADALKLAGHYMLFNESNNQRFKL